MSATHTTSLRVSCPKCRAPKNHWCVNENGVQRHLSHAERVRAAKDVPIITSAQLEALDKVAADSDAVMPRSVESALRTKGWSVESALRTKGWIRSIDPPTPPAPEGRRYLRRPKRRHEVTKDGQLVRATARRTT